jgi:hypothetical protein
MITSYGLKKPALPGFAVKTIAVWALYKRSASAVPVAMVIMAAESSTYSIYD